MRIIQAFRGRLIPTLHPIRQLIQRALSSHQALIPIAAIALTALTLVFSVLPANSGTGLTDEVAKFEQTLTIAQQHALGHVDIRTMTDAAIQGALGVLDPYSYYFTEGNAAEFDRPNAHKLVTGVRTYQFGRDLIVWSVEQGSSASQAGLLPGDRILKINSTEAAKLTDRQADLILNPPVDQTGYEDTTRPIVLVIKRPTDTAPREMELYARSVPAQPQPVAVALDDSTVAIRFTDFHTGTAREVTALLQDARNEGTRRFIIDLRNNNGGLVDEAVALADHLCSTTDELLTIRDDTGRRSAMFGHGWDVLRTLPIVVLIGPDCASAAEIFAGILQDRDRALIIGEPSYGKALVMNEYALADGSRIRLVTSRYYLPSGRFIQLAYRYGDLLNARPAILHDVEDLAHRHDSLYGASAQGFETRTGRIVHGGEGIIPDVIVRKSPTLALGTVRDCSTILWHYAERYLELHAEEINKQYTSATIGTLRLPRTLAKDLAAMSLAQGFEASTTQVQHDVASISHAIVTMIAWRLYGQAAYSRSLLSGDHTFREASHDLPKAMAFVTQPRSEDE